MQQLRFISIISVKSISILIGGDVMLNRRGNNNGNTRLRLFNGCKPSNSNGNDRRTE